MTFLPLTRFQHFQYTFNTKRNMLIAIKNILLFSNIFHKFECKMTLLASRFTNLHQITSVGVRRKSPNLFLYVLVHPIIRRQRLIILVIFSTTLATLTESNWYEKWKWFSLPAHCCMLYRNCRFILPFRLSFLLANYINSYANSLRWRGKIVYQIIQ